MIEILHSVIIVGVALLLWQFERYLKAGPWKEHPNDAVYVSAGLFYIFTIVIMIAWYGF